MDKAFWLQRWERGETGWHLPRVHPKLQKYWFCVLAAEKTIDAATVWVPLCGKSLDMMWLREQGLHVIGSDLSAQALNAFIAEHRLDLVRTATGYGEQSSAQGWTLQCGDVFALQAADLAGVRYIYDRAALIALPQDLRMRYVAHLRSLFSVSMRLLLITLSYEQTSMAGPPFSVDDAEVRSLFDFASLQLLESQNIIVHEPRFAARGLTALWENVYCIEW